MPEVVAEFISHPRASMSTRDTPIRASVGSEANSSYQVHTATIKAFKDLDQTIRVPEFTGWETVNLVCLRFTGDWMYFWVTASRTSSTVMGAVEFALTYNGPLSQLGLNGTYTASVMRSPKFSATKQAAVISGAMNTSRTVQLGSIDKPSTQASATKVFWVQITATELLTDSASPVSDKMQVYAFFTPFTNGNINTYLNASGPHPMPSLYQVLADIESLGFSSAQVITDISISEICPFAYELDASNLYCLYTDSTKATELKPFMPYDTSIAMWRVLGLGQNIYGVSRTVTMTLSEMEMSCGNVTILDVNGSSIGNVPTAWFGSDRSLTFDVRVISDYSSMTYRIDADGSVFQAPTGHLPYVGSAWETYQAYSLAYDREAMELSIETANRQTELAINTGIANAAIGAVSSAASLDVVGTATGIASSAVSLYQTAASNTINTDSIRSQQAITEKRMQAQPGTAYASQYGLSYAFNASISPACIQLSMPVGLTSSIYEAYRDAFGLPCETVDDETTITAGYWQLRFSTQTGLDSGPRFDRLNSMIANGIRITGRV